MSAIVANGQNIPESLVISMSCDQTFDRGSRGVNKPREGLTVHAHPLVMAGLKIIV